MRQQCRQTRFGNRTGLTGNGVWDGSWRSGCPRDGIAGLSGRLTVIARRDGVLENRLGAAVSGEVPEAAADGCGGPRNRAGRPRLRPCRRGRRECDVGAAVHRDRRHDHASGCGRCRLEVRHREGRAAAALSMFAAFLFGYVLHFVADVPTCTRTWADRMGSCISIRRPASRWWSLPAPYSGSMS